MVKVKLNVKIKRRNSFSVYVRLPSDAFNLFLTEVEKVKTSLNKKKKTNKAFLKLLKEEQELFKELEKVFYHLDRETPSEVKRALDSFYRIFQRLSWAKDAGSEREIELKGWILSSLDYLVEEFLENEE